MTRVRIIIKIKKLMNFLAKRLGWDIGNQECTQEKINNQIDFGNYYIMQLDKYLKGTTPAPIFPGEEEMNKMLQVPKFDDIDKGGRYYREDPNSLSRFDNYDY